MSCWFAVLPGTLAAVPGRIGRLLRSLTSLAIRDCTFHSSVPSDIPQALPSIFSNLKPTIKFDHGRFLRLLIRTHLFSSFLFCSPLRHSRGPIPHPHSSLPREGCKLLQEGEERRGQERREEGRGGEEKPDEQLGLSLAVKRFSPRACWRPLELF